MIAEHAHASVDVAPDTNQFDRRYSSSRIGSPVVNAIGRPSAFL
jgi:hypothetical protein